MKLKDKNITVIGLGKSGFSATKLLKKFGANVKVSDNRKNPKIKKKSQRLKKIGLEVEIGRHTEKLLKGQELIVTSPGVSDESFPLRYAYENNIPVFGEVELGYRCCNVPIIAISGTNGKTTVATMLHSVLKKIGVDAVLCGNMGIPITSVIMKREKPSFLVLEVSSFQLERIKNFRPFIGVLLEVTGDHLDRHKNEFSYKLAKYNIFKNQTKDDWSIIVNPDKRLIERKDKFVYFNESTIGPISNNFYKRSSGKIKKLLSDKELDINKKVVLAVLFLLKQDLENYLDYVLKFKNLPHRLEFVTKIGNVNFINDSKSTNISSTMWALKKYDKVILIAGGINKNLDFSLISKWVKSKVKHVVVLGESSQEIKKAFENISPVHEVKDIREAVNKSYKLSAPGDNILLSPMCSSFDMFKNYEDRGNKFKSEVSNLREAI